MPYKELLGLLQALRGPNAGNAVSPGLFGQLPSLIPSSSAPSASTTEGRRADFASSTLRRIGGGLTLAPMVGALLNLFGAKERKGELPTLEPFELPAPIRVEAGLSSNGDIFQLSRGAGDQLRRTTPRMGRSQQADSGILAQSERSGQERPLQAGMVTVNVHAMDSQSFLDRKEDIARAVREAMLQSHSLNDVVSEL